MKLSLRAEEHLREPFHADGFKVAGDMSVDEMQQVSNA